LHDVFQFHPCSATRWVSGDLCVPVCQPRLPRNETPGGWETACRNEHWQSQC